MMRYEDNISEVTDENFSVCYKYGEDRSWTDKQLHWHEELEIICYASGESKMICGRESFIPEPRGIYVVNPYELHDLHSDKGCERHLLLVGKKMLRDLGCENLRFKHHMAAPEIADIFDRMYAESERNDEYTKNALMALATEILVRLWVHAQKQV